MRNFLFSAIAAGLLLTASELDFNTSLVASSFSFFAATAISVSVDVLAAIKAGRAALEPNSKPRRYRNRVSDYLENP